MQLTEAPEVVVVVCLFVFSPAGSVLAVVVVGIGEVTVGIEGDAWVGLLVSPLESPPHPPRADEHSRGPSNQRLFSLPASSPSI